MAKGSVVALISPNGLLFSGPTIFAAMERYMAALGNEDDIVKTDKPAGFMVGVGKTCGWCGHEV